MCLADGFPDDGRLLPGLCLSAQPGEVSECDSDVTGGIAPRRPAMPADAAGLAVLCPRAAGIG